MDPTFNQPNRTRKFPLTDMPTSPGRGEGRLDRVGGVKVDPVLGR